MTVHSAFDVEAGIPSPVLPHLNLPGQWLVLPESRKWGRRPTPDTPLPGCG